MWRNGRQLGRLTRAASGRNADQAAWRRLFRIFWQAGYNFNKDNGWVLAGHIAYMGLFALFPFLIFLLAIAGFVGQSDAASTSIQLALELLPPEVARGIAPAVEEVRATPHAGLITTSILIALWAASAGLEALRHALNSAYDVRNPPHFLRSRVESLLLTILAALTVILAMVLLFIVPIALDIVAWTIDQAVPMPVGLTEARWLLGLGLLLGLLLILYKILPNVQLRAMEIFPGAVLAWVLWVALHYAYTLYLRFVPSYSVTYGSLGGIVVTLFFFYISALLFIFGAEFNSVLKRRRENRTPLPKR